MKIQTAIDKYIKNGNVKGLKKILPKLKVEYQKRSEEEKNFRSGEETYGYDNVRIRMEHISDRWNCAFRIKWIIDGIEGGRF
jgi:hypothetical protein